ncbi:MAG: MerR family transcriptional regulator [Bacteroidetes bacterium]|nr:MerR family transcriptional regulator [Bacteroidota bacterium]
MQTDLGVYDPVLTIGTVAKMLDIAVQTIRMYEQEGLIIAYKTEGGHRMYSLHDVERLRCIRKMITEHGLNINGIRKMMSLVPCWGFKGGLDDECRQCPVYYDAEGPCWAQKNVGSKCRLADCRSCPVYRIEFNCTTIKEVVFGHKRDIKPLSNQEQKK